MRVFICSDTTEVECYENILFDFGSDAESLNLYENINSFESKSMSSSDSSPQHRVSITFNFEDIENRNESYEYREQASSLFPYRNLIFESNQDYTTARGLLPSPIHTRNGRFLISPTNQTRNNYRILTQNLLRNQQANALTYRDNTTYNTLTNLRERDTGLFFKALFILLVISLTYTAILH